MSPIVAQVYKSTHCVKSHKKSHMLQFPSAILVLDAGKHLPTLLDSIQKSTAFYKHLPKLREVHITAAWECTPTPHALAAMGCGARHRALRTDREHGEGSAARWRCSRRGEWLVTWRERGGFGGEKGEKHTLKTGEHGDNGKVNTVTTAKVHRPSMKHVQLAVFCCFLTPI